MQQAHITCYYRNLSCQSAKTSGDEIKLGQEITAMKRLKGESFPSVPDVTTTVC